MVGKFSILSLILYLFASSLPGEELFTEIEAGLIDLHISSHAWCDINGNGLLDLAMLGRIHSAVNQTRIYLNNGDDTFSETMADLPGLERGAIAWGDYDNDGHPDLFFCGGYSFSAGDNVSLLYRNNGDGSFTDSGIFLPKISNASAIWADFNNDGYLDLLLNGSNEASSPPILRIFLHNGDSSFIEHDPGITATYYGSLDVADFDNDGLIDILVTGDTGGDSGLVTELYRNVGDANFELVYTAFPALRYSSVAWGDFDNDGFADLLISGFDDNSSRITRLYRNLGNSPSGEHLGFEEVQNHGLLGLANSAVAWGDYDNDGYLDLFMFGRDNENVYHTKIYRNLANGLDGLHLGFQEISFDADGRYGGDVSWGDYDSDGRLDLLISGRISGGRATSLYRNNTAIANEPPLSPILNVQTNGRRVDFLFSGSQDDTTTEEALRYNIRLGYTPGGIEISSPMATECGYRKVPCTSNLRRSWHLILQPGYYFAAAQAVDNGFAGSPFSSEVAFSLIETLLDPLNGREIKPTLTIADIEFSSFISINSSWGSGIPALPDPGLTLTLSGNDLSGAELSIDPDLGFIPHSIAFRPGDSDQYHIIDNPGDWTSSEVTFSLPENESTDALEIIFPARADEPLPLALSSFLPLLTPEETVLLEWVVEAETNILGYNILRAETEYIEESIRLNPSLILGHNSSGRCFYSFNDCYVTTGTCYFYWLESLDISLFSSFHGPVSILVKQPEIEGDVPQPEPVSGLVATYPNPFNSGTTVKFILLEEEFVTLDLFNLRGEHVCCLAYHRYYPPGEHFIHWDGLDSAHKICRSGIYIIRLRIGAEYEEYRKVCRIK